MNAFMSYYNPLNAMRQGQDIEEGDYQAHLEGQRMRDEQELREAMAEHGMGDYYTGYENVPGAIRPNYLKRLFMEGNPDAAFKMESMLSAPFQTERDIYKAGRIEEEKKNSDYRANRNLLRDLGELPEGSLPGSAPANAQPSNALLNYLTPQTEAGGEGEASPASTMPAYGLAQLPTRQRSVTLGPTGLSITSKTPSPLESAGTINDIVTKRDTVNVSKWQLERETVKDRNQQIEQAHQRVKTVQEQIRAVQKDMQDHNITQAEGRATLKELQQEEAQARAERDALVRGKVPAAQSAPEAAPTMMPSPRSMRPANEPVSSAPGMTEKDTAQLAQEGRKEQITAANKEIANAREHALKIQQYMPQIKEIFDLATKHDIGAPVIGNLPGGVGTTALMLDKDYARLKNLNDALTNMFSQPGQSQLMNTIIERQMQSATVPGITVEPQQNKMNAAIVRSNMEHLLQFPSFLEKWQKTHHGTLEGATEAWIDYTQHNPGYTYQKDKRGRVTVQDNKRAMTIEKWMSMKEQGRIRTLTDGRTFVQQGDGSWLEQ